MSRVWHTVGEEEDKKHTFCLFFWDCLCEIVVPKTAVVFKREYEAQEPPKETKRGANRDASWGRERRNDEKKGNGRIT